MTERQARVLELHHEGKSSREISAVLKAEAAGKPKGWGASYNTVATDIRRAIEYHRQIAVDFYEATLTQELSRCDFWIKQATQAWLKSSTKKVERGRTTTTGGAIVDETTTKAEDAELSREVREWQEQKIKLLGVVRENGTKPNAQSEGTGADANLPQYWNSLQLYAASVASQSMADVPPNGPAEPVHSPPTHAAPSPLPTAQ